MERVVLARCNCRRRWAALGGATALFLVAGLGLWIWLLAGLPSVDALSDSSLHGYAAAPSSKVYDRYGRLLFEMPPPFTGRHTPVPLNQIPVDLRQAVIATEDATFYQNPGVDAWAILRAVWINVQGGEALSGGSTITQQLARNLLLSPEERYERTLRRKLREAILAWQLARRYSKDEILGLYLNEIYFGNMAYGVEAAAQAYFGKPVRDLDLAECALLAGLPQAPALYNPLENLDRAKERQAVVLDLMTRHGYLDAEAARLAREEKLHFASGRFEIRAPHFTMYVRGLLEQELGLERLEQGGLQIYTTLDLDLNETARDLVRLHLARLATCHIADEADGRRTDCPPGGHNVRNAALVALDPETGEILAMLGSPDYFSSRIDGAVNGATAFRQPGSSIKPITYAAAFEQADDTGDVSLTPATMMVDVRTSFLTKEGMPYVPLNYDLQFRGPVRLREALASSYNVIAVKVLDTIGVDRMTSLARRLGISTFDDPDRLGLAVTLGGGEVRLLELAAAYAALANGGRAIQPVAILAVVDAQGDTVLQAANSLEAQVGRVSQPGMVGDAPAPGEGIAVLDPRAAYLVTDILSDDTARIPSFGEGSVLRLSRPAAVKTGTTTDFRDNWTVGYTPELVVGVWAGNADNEPMRGISGVSGAAPIWHDFVEAALKGQPARDFSRPEGLVEVEVCALSGLLPGPDCPHRVTELFLTGTEPTETCTMHQRVSVDRATGLRATPDTPPERVVERVYAVLPPEAQDWAREKGIPQLPPPSTPPEVSPGSPTRRLQAAKVAPQSKAPSLTISNPDRGAVFQLHPGLPRDAQRIVVSAVPVGEVSLAQVSLLVDGQPLARFSAPPYRLLWQLEPGRHSFSAEGVDISGQRLRSDEVWVVVGE